MEENNTTGDLMEAAAPANGQDTATQEQVVPVHVVQSLRGENQELKQNLKILAEHLELLKANQPKKQDPVSQLNDDEVLTVGEAKKYISTMQRQHEMSIEELKIAQMYPDYAETVRKYLPEVLKGDPDLKTEIENARNPFKLAYQLAKRSESYYEDQRKNKRNADADRVIQNAQKTGVLNSVGSGSPVSQASRWKSMPDDEFRKVMNKNMGHF